MIAIVELSILAFEQKNNYNELYRLLRELHELEWLQSGEYIDDIHNTKAQLQALYTEKYRGALVRARAQCLLEEQACSRSLGDERRQALSKQILDIDYGGIVVNVPTLITKAFFEHYQKLFRSHKPSDTGVSATKFVSLLPQLNQDDYEYTNDDIDIIEITACIDSLAKAKTPGPGGLTAEFYQCFRSLLSSLLLQVYREALEVGYLPVTMYEGHTVLIAKSNDETKLQKVDGYRPISLCNVHYNFFAKVLANRLQVVIKSVVSDHASNMWHQRSVHSDQHSCCEIGARVYS